MPSEVVDLLLPLDALQGLGWRGDGSSGGVDGGAPQSALVSTQQSDETCTVEERYESRIREVGMKMYSRGCTPAAGDACSMVGFCGARKGVHSREAPSEAMPLSLSRMRHYRGLQIIGTDGPGPLQGVVREKTRRKAARSYTNKKIVCQCRGVAPAPIEYVPFPTRQPLTSASQQLTQLPPLPGGRQQQVTAGSSGGHAVAVYAPLDDEDASLYSHDGMDDEAFFYMTPSDSAQSKLLSSAHRSRPRANWDEHFHLAGLLRPPRITSPSTHQQPFSKERGLGTLGRVPPGAGGALSQAARLAHDLVVKPGGHQRKRAPSPSKGPVRIGW
eukprot:TRINITY_DN22929_c0_g1_i1.p1 TRINITY_DN22929_c0_g1~~TRINITY_DN22929_c0_g1_i1.p1  ORF type:complete len:329 (+),score=48.72 TRINITY_DN22929_c0_g1_i1:47-1033(+)